MADRHSPGPSLQAKSEAAFRDAKCFACGVAFFVKNAKDPTEKPSGHFLRCIKCRNTFHAGCVQISRSMAKQLADNYVCPFCINNEPSRATAKKTSNGRIVRSTITTKAPAPGSKRTQSTEPSQDIKSSASDSACAEGKRTRAADNGLAELEAKTRALRDKEAELQSQQEALTDKLRQLETEQRKLAEASEQFEREKQRFELQKSAIAATLGSGAHFADGAKQNTQNIPFEAEKSVLRLTIQYQDWKMRRLLDQFSGDRSALPIATSVSSAAPVAQQPMRASISFVQTLKDALQGFPDRQLATACVALFETDIWSSTTADEVQRFLEERKLETTPLISMILKVAASGSKGQ